MLGATAPSAGYYSYTTYRQLPGDEFASIPGTTVPDAEFMHTGGPLYMFFFIVRWICTALTVVSCSCAGFSGVGVFGDCPVHPSRPLRLRLLWVRPLI